MVKVWRPSFISLNLVIRTKMEARWMKATTSDFKGTNSLNIDGLVKWFIIKFLINWQSSATSVILEHSSKVVTLFFTFFAALIFCKSRLKVSTSHVFQMNVRIHLVCQCFGLHTIFDIIVNYLDDIVHTNILNYFYKLKMKYFSIVSPHASMPLIGCNIFSTLSHSFVSCPPLIVTGRKIVGKWITCYISIRPHIIRFLARRNGRPLV